MSKKLRSQTVDTDASMKLMPSSCARSRVAKPSSSDASGRSSWCPAHYIRLIDHYRLRLAYSMRPPAAGSFPVVRDGARHPKRRRRKVVELAGLAIGDSKHSDQAPQRRCSHPHSETIRDPDQSVMNHALSSRARMEGRSTHGHGFTQLGVGYSSSSRRVHGVMFGAGPGRKP